MYQVENEQLKIIIRSKGAELDSVYNKHDGLEYMWSGDPAFWGKKSPVLFPIVGTLKNDTYFFKGKSYQLPRHGFARDMEFAVTAQTANSICFSLTASEETLSKFPFHFRLDIIYTIEKNKLSVTYSVNNTVDTDMYFSVGGHPAFKLPLARGLRYDDYYLELNETENAGRWPISKDGLIETEALSLFENTNRLPLNKSLFEKDALVFKGLASDNISLKSDKDPHGLSFGYKGFPYLGIWAAKNADFICIEPWCGIADNVNTDQQLRNKEGIQMLPAGENFKREWTITVF